MIKQQLFRMDGRGSRTVASSPGMKNSVWLQLLEQQLELVDFSMLSVPTFYQYPLGRAIVVSRCLPDPTGRPNSYLAHQLVFDEPDDLQMLMSMRPLSARMFFDGGYVTGVSSDTLPMLPASALENEGALEQCYEALDALFADRPELLGKLLSALALSARDKRQHIRVVINDRPEAVSECGRRLMELLLRCLKANDAMRVSYSTLQMSPSPEMQYTICFAPPTGSKPDSHEITLRFPEGSINIPANAVLPETERYLEIARQLLAHDIQRVEMFRGEGQVACATPDSLRMNVRPFDKGMSLTEYVDRWSEALELRRPLLTERGFTKLLAHEWKKLLGSVIDASEQMDNLSFLTQFNDIIRRVYQDQETSVITPDSDTMIDMLVLLLDSIRWQELDLTDAKVWRLVRTITGYAQLLNHEEYADMSCVNACRIMNQVLTSPSSAWETLLELSLLDEDAPECAAALQECLRKYVQTRLESEFDVADEHLAAAAMLGLVKFSEGIPDLRMVDKLTARIEAQHGAADAHRFEEIIERMRRHLHSTGRFHWREVKTLMTVSMILVGLIAGIWIWFLCFG